MARRKIKPDDRNQKSPEPTVTVGEIDSAWIRFAAEPECQEMVQQLAGQHNAYSTIVPTHQPGIFRITDATDPIPTKIGRFMIERILGSGSFGTVYKARDPLYERPVALKVIHPGRIPDIERVLEEAKATVKIRDRRIVRAFEVAKEENGTMYIAMEYVPGGSLRGRLQTGGINYRDAVEMMEAIVDAVSVAHAHGFIHRDLKPENILIDKRGNPKIADFGLVLSLTNDSLAGLEVAGAPPYMSPEQVRGQLALVDKRSDIWSLGVVFYEMLTGCLPFSGSRSRIFQQIQGQRIIPPQHLNPCVPPRVAAICMKCLERNPDDRFQTASQLVNALHRCKPSEQRQERKPAPIDYEIWPSRIQDFQLISVSVTFGIIFGVVLAVVSMFMLAMNPDSFINVLFDSSSYDANGEWP